MKTIWKDLPRETKEQWRKWYEYHTAEAKYQLYLADPEALIADDQRRKASLEAAGWVVTMLDGHIDKISLQPGAKLGGESPREIMIEVLGVLLQRRAPSALLLP